MADLVTGAPKAAAPFAGFLDSKAAAAFAGGIGSALGGQPSSAVAHADQRSWMDGSGWTVSTGSSKASGGRSGGAGTGTGTDAFGASQAGLNPLMLLLLAGAAWYVARS